MIELNELQAFFLLGKVRSSIDYLEKITPKDPSLPAYQNIDSDLKMLRDLESKLTKEAYGSLE